MNRRTLIKSILTSPITLGMSSGLLPNLLVKSAFAQEQQRPIRNLFIYHPNGAVPDLFHPQAGSAKLPGMTAPLERVKQHCVFMDGFGLDGHGDTHEGGVARVLTGNHASSDSLRGTSSSIDVLMGQENFAKGVNPIAPSVQMGLFSSKWAGKSISFQDTIRLPYFDDPLSLYANLFSGINGEQGSSESQTDYTVFNSAKSDLIHLQNKLGAVEKQRLEVHMDAFSALEAKLRVLATNTAGDACKRVNLRGIRMEDWRNEDPAGPMERVSEAQQDIAVQALSCDVTRVISFMYSHAVSPITTPTSSMRDHDASHSDPESHRKSKVWWMAEIAKFIQKLADTPDGQNQSLLDNTLVFLVSDLGHGTQHDHWRMPFLLAGGKNTGLQVGRSMDYRGTGTTRFGWKKEFGQGHANLLQTIAQRSGYNFSIPLATGTTPYLW